METGTSGAYDLAPCALLTLAPSGVIEEANQAACSWTRFGREELLGKRLPDLFTMGSKLFHQTHLLPLMEMQGSVAEVQIELVQKDGNRLPALMNVARRPDGRVDVALFAAVDRRKYERELLAARRRAEDLLEALTQREAEFRAIAENSPDVIAHFDREGRCTYVSRAIEVLGPHAAEALVGKRLDELGLGEPARAYVALLDRALGGEMVTEVFDYRMADGALRHLEVRFVPEKRTDGTVGAVLSLTRDVTALKERERDAQIRAVLAEQLVGIVSHDLRNPLNAIVLGAELLAGEDLGESGRVVQRIASAANRANRLTNELLDFTQARLGGGLRVVPSEVALHVVVGETVEELRLAHPKRAIAHERVGAGTAQADADRIAQVVANLVGNAVAYGTPERPIVVRSRIDEASVAIEVHNEGRPIPPELLPTVFEPMRRGDEQVQRGSRSVGLGLYIVREIATAHRGTVAVESTLEAGTTFRVTIPRHR